MYILYRYCWIILLAFASSTPQAYCTQQVLRLRFDLKKEAVKYHEVSTGEQEAFKHSKNFDQLLKAVQFFPYVIKTKTGIKIPKNVKRYNLPSDYVQSADD
jgi:hypothetical protein